MPILYLLLLFILTSYDLCELSYNYINSVYPLFLFNQNKTFSKLIGTNNKTFSSCTKQKELSQTEFYQWFAGFIDGEATFSTNKYIPRFKLENNIKELELYNKIREFLNTGKVLYTSSRLDK